MASKRRANETERSLRRTKAVELRAGHTSYRRIAELLGVSVWTAFNDVQKAIREEIDRRKESTDIVIEFELKRLDMMGAILMQELRDGHAAEKREAIKGLLQVMSRRARYLGLDAPAKADAKVEHSYESMIRRIHERRDELEKALAARGQASGGNGA